MYPCERVVRPRQNSLGRVAAPLQRQTATNPSPNELRSMSSSVGSIAVVQLWILLPSRTRWSALQWCAYAVATVRMRLSSRPVRNIIPKMRMKTSFTLDVDSDGATSFAFARLPLQSIHQRVPTHV